MTTAPTRANVGARAASHALAANPLIGVRRKEIARTMATLASQLVRQPRTLGRIYGGDFRSDPALVSDTLRHVRFSSRRGYCLQLAAVFGWTSLPWLWTLTQPTLIMAGQDDPIVPAVNARLMHALIRNARIETLDCGHLFLVTRPRQSARIVDDFLTSRHEETAR